MSLWVKICGNTRLEDALTAVEAGADALGFVFAPSPRQVDAAAVEAMMPALAGRAECIGVFVDATAETIARTVERCGLTGVQLHGGSQSRQTAAVLKARWGQALRLLQVVHYGPQSAAELEAIVEAGNCDAVLVDTRVGGMAGGTGVAFDWTEAAGRVFAPASGASALVAPASGLAEPPAGQSGANPALAAMPRVAAGGLRPENVAEAIGILRPWGVDVASGVEAAPGRKDPERVREFVRRARAAAGSI